MKSIHPAALFAMTATLLFAGCGGGGEEALAVSLEVETLRETGEETETTTFRASPNRTASLFLVVLRSDRRRFVLPMGNTAAVETMLDATEMDFDTTTTSMSIGFTPSADNPYRQTHAMAIATEAASPNQAEIEAAVPDPFAPDLSEDALLEELERVAESLRTQYSCAVAVKAAS